MHHLARERHSALIVIWLIVSLVLATGVARSQDRKTPGPGRSALPPPLPDRLLGGEPRTVADLRQMEAHTVALAAEVLRATVSIGGASGVLVKGGHVLTAGHVSRNYDRGRRTPRITLFDGRQVAVRFLGRAERVDAGLAEVSGADALPFLEMGRSAALRPGTWCLMLGFPGGPKPWRPASIRLGRVLEVREDGSMVTDCTMQSGDSGGPLVDMQGRVIGINSRITRDLTTNVHVQIDAFHDHWEQLVAGERDRGRYGTLRSVSSRAASRDAPEVRKVFQPVVAATRKSAVEILGDGKPVALGAVVHADGYVITKASALRGKLSVRFAGKGEPVAARRVATQERNDLALLQVDTQHLVPVQWASGVSVEVGRWLATPGLDSSPVSWGIVSVPLHERPSRAYLGVRMKIRRSGVEIRATEPDSPATRAGLAAGDVIVSLNGKPMDRGRTWRRAIAEKKPGDEISLVVRRGTRSLAMCATLTRSRRPSGRSPSQQNLWGPLSPVRFGFSSVLQHDTVLAPNECGGPLVDLDGKAVGLNIARASRVETLALPAATVEAAVRELLGQSY